MCIKVIKEGNSLRVLETSEDIPDGTELTLFTEAELTALIERRNARMTAQMPSFIRGDEQETAEELLFSQIGLAAWATDPADAGVDWELFFQSKPTPS